MELYTIDMVWIMLGLVIGMTLFIINYQHGVIEMNNDTKFQVGDIVKFGDKWGQVTFVDKSAYPIEVYYDVDGTCDYFDAGGCEIAFRKTNGEILEFVERPSKEVDKLREENLKLKEKLRKVELLCVNVLSTNNFEHFMEIVHGKNWAKENK